MRELYVGDGFRKATAYFDSGRVPWFVLSAAYGLLTPDAVIGLYDVRLSDRSRRYCEAWGGWVVAQLEEQVGPLRGITIELQAGESYVGPLRRGLEALGAVIDEPLAGLRQGERLAWYSQLPTVTTGSGRPLSDELVELLQNALPFRRATSHRLARHSLGQACTHGGSMALVQRT